MCSFCRAAIVISFLLASVCTATAQSIPTEMWLPPLAPTGTAPQTREFPSSVYDPISNRLIMFGGCTGGTGGCNFSVQAFNDVWVLTNANGSGGVPAWIQLTPTGGPPSVRHGHTVVYDGATNRMVIFGGDSSLGSLPNLSDVWVLENANGLDRSTGLPATPIWTQLAPLPGPTAREFSRAVYDPFTNRMIVYSGTVCPTLATCQPTNEVWALTNANGLGGTAQWIHLSPHWRSARSSKLVDRGLRSLL